MREHRKHERVPFRTQIQYRGDGGEHFLLEDSCNVSEGGIFIATRRPAPIGAALEVSFDIPDTGDHIVASGTVVWVNEWRDDGPNPNPGMGIRFERMSDEHRRAIQSVVRRIAIVPSIPEAPAA